MRNITAQEANALVEKFKLLQSILEPMYESIRRAATLGQRTVVCFCGGDHKDLLADRLRIDGFQVKMGVYHEQGGLPVTISW